MRDNVKVMTDVFRRAMEFEQYKYLWNQALLQVDSLIMQNQQRQKEVLDEMQREQRWINNVEERYADITQEIKATERKRNIKRLLLILFWFVPPFGTVICSYLIWRDREEFFSVRQSAKGVSPEAAQRQKQESRTNVQNYQAFLEKAKKEYDALLVKKSAIQKELAKADAVLKEIYGKGWIHPKYQSLVPMATIYGYLNRGVCTIIRGHGGVYERYDDDLKHAEIVGHLKDIKRNQQIMIRNQQELLNVVRSIDSALGSIQRELVDANEKLGDIRTNTGIAAAAAQQSAAYQGYIANAVWRNM